MLYINFFFKLIVFFKNKKISMSEYPIITIPLGSIKGRKCVKPEHDGAKQVFRFSNIPFAKPPVQDLRFEPPQK